MRTLPPPGRVLGLLRGRRTVMEAARLTGWPERSVRTLATRQPGWLIGADGRVSIHSEKTASTPKVSPDGDARPGPILHAAVDARRRRLDLTWKDVADQVGVSAESLRLLATDRATLRTRVLVEDWLASSQSAAPPKPAEELYRDVQDRKDALRLTWPQVAPRLHTNVMSLRNMRTGRLHRVLREQVETWLDETAPDRTGAIA
ncbi:hypothetical protein [Sphaerisporangium sp. NPDC051011]|uniref:hypothetical protein n=1 Tax=Sphaerisporangium sp. NPDC051011 TaxID=3155792 RepID=UPI0033D954EA